MTPGCASSRFLWALCREDQRYTARAQTAYGRVMSENRAVIGCSNGLLAPRRDAMAAVTTRGPLTGPVFTCMVADGGDVGSSAAAAHWRSRSGHRREADNGARTGRRMHVHQTVPGPQQIDALFTFRKNKGLSTSGSSVHLGASGAGPHPGCCWLVGLLRRRAGAGRREPAPLFRTTST